MYALSATITKAGILLPLMNKINKPTNVNASMSQTTGIPSWILVIILTAVTLFLVIRTLRKPNPKIAVPKLKQRYSGIRHYLFEKLSSICSWNYCRIDCFISMAYELFYWT